MSCNCTTPCTSTCPSYCGCTVQVPGTCVFYQGPKLDCIDATKGDTYDSILTTINSIVCGLEPPSGITTTITGCSSILVRNPSTNVFNICLSTTTENQINNNTSNIAALSACIANTVKDITSSDGSVTISTTGTNSCGRTINLQVAAPPTPVVLDGIIYSDSTKNEANSGAIGFDQVLKTSSTSIGSYVTANGLQVGDEIRWRANGQMIGNGDLADVLKFDLFDGVSGILGGNAFGGFNTALNILSSWQLEGTATVLDNTAGASVVLVSAKLFRTSSQNGTVDNDNRDMYLINQTISNIALSSLQIRIKYVRNVPAGLSASNFARQLVVEIRKSI
jgi:hypothetical protein